MAGRPRNPHSGDNGEGEPPSDHSRDERAVGLNSGQPVWTGEVTERLRCCVCGDATDDADDYVLLQLTAGPSGAVQWLGAHAAHLNGVLARGFEVEVHLM
ncbi:hypothetical protein [Symbioplanes lichenis]|uniref:hypothetical protein n=1 Tax=Symbioplanes lichenis TaxID=1629072 RepID=UPI002738F93B|nr:hypothetical protein [Actinoplanes lichenis]